MPEQKKITKMQLRDLVIYARSAEAHQWNYMVGDDERKKSEDRLLALLNDLQEKL